MCYVLGSKWHKSTLVQITAWCHKTIWNIGRIYWCIYAFPASMCLTRCTVCWQPFNHDDVIKWKHFPRYWPFVRGIHRSPVNSPHEGQWRGALMFPLICVWINSWVNNPEAGNLRRHRAHCNVSVMWCGFRLDSTSQSDALKKMTV